MRTHCTPSGGRAHFIRHAPKRPRAADDYTRGVQIMPKRAALECASIQLQPPDMRASISADLDSPESYTVIREMDFPTPQLIMVNPANGHAHAIWQLREPVGFGEATRRTPQRAFLDLQRQITTLYGADLGYPHYMVKTPGHSRWHTVETGAALYTMPELYEAMPAGIRKLAAQQRAERQAQGEGRHSTLWEIGRRWAYGEARRFKRRGTRPQWYAHVLAEFKALNSFALPLPAREVESLARYVAGWTWDNAERLNGSVLDGEKRSLIPSWKREALTEEQRTQRRSQGARYANAAQRNATDDAITAAIAELAGEGVHAPSVTLIAQRAGVTRPTVYAFRKRQGVQAGEGN